MFYLSLSPTGVPILRLASRQAMLNPAAARGIFVKCHSPILSLPTIPSPLKNISTPLGAGYNAHDSTSLTSLSSPTLPNGIHPTLPTLARLLLLKHTKPDPCSRLCMNWLLCLKILALGVWLAAAFCHSGNSLKLPWRAAFRDHET